MSNVIKCFPVIFNHSKHGRKHLVKVRPEEVCFDMLNRGILEFSKLPLKKSYFFLSIASKIKKAKTMDTDNLWQVQKLWQKLNSKLLDESLIINIFT